LLVVLHASDMGMPVYAKIGFVTVANFIFLESEKNPEPIRLMPIALDYAW
jgi:hypothetical protein